jgi:hypothetical protein
LNLREVFEVGLLNYVKAVKTLGTLGDGISILHYEMAKSLWEPRWNVMVGI